MQELTKVMQHAEFTKYVRPLEDSKELIGVVPLSTEKL